MRRAHAAFLALAIAGAPAARAQIVTVQNGQVQSAVHLLTPRLQALNGVFLGHWPDPLSDVLRNPAIASDTGAIGILADGDVGAWALQARGRSAALGWSAGLVAGPAVRDVAPNQFIQGIPVVFDTVRAAVLPSAVVPSTTTRLEGHVGLSSPLAGGARVGAALVLGMRPTSDTKLTSGSSTIASSRGGDGWGLTTGWAGGGGGAGGAWTADLAVGWQDGSTKDSTGASFGPTTPPGHLRQREGWTRLLLRGAGGFSVSLTARRRLVDAERLPSFGSVLNDSTLRGTEVELALARRWQGQGWSAALLAGLAASWVRAVRSDSTSNPFVRPPATSRTNGENDQAGPFLGAAAEASLGAGFLARASLVARASRSAIESDGTSFGTAFTADQTSYNATTDVRFGAGFAPTGSPFAVDLYLPTLVEPKRWVAAAAYRF